MIVEHLVIVLSAMSLCALNLLATDSEDLFKAIQTGEIGKVAAILDRQPNLANARNQGGASAVLFALYTRHADVADLLISRGATIGFPEACALGRFDLVKSAVQGDPSIVNKLSSDGFTPLSLATFFAHHDVVILLLAHHADPNIQSQNRIQITPLHSAVERRDPTLVEILLSHGADPNATEFLGGTPLHSAAMGGLEAIVQLLIRHGANTTLKMNDGRTAQELAAAYKHPDLADWLRAHENH